MTPARGLVYLRAVRTAETLAGGRIVLTQNVRDQWTGQQAEVVAVGALERCEDWDCEREHTGPQREHEFYVRVGAWVLVEPRGFVEVTEDVWALPQRAVLAVLQP